MRVLGKQVYFIIPLALMIAFVPYALPLVMMWFLVKSAIRGQPPQDRFSFLLWIFSVFVLGSLSLFPKGSLAELEAWLSVPGNAQTAVFVDCVLVTLLLFLLIMTFRRSELFRAYFPLKNIKIDFPFIVLLLISVMPLIGIAFDTELRGFKNPWQLAVSQVFIQNSSTIAVLASFLALGLLGPVFEEIVFRGILVGHFIENSRGKTAKWIAILLPSVLFGLAHPYFLLPFIFSLCLYYVKSRYQNIVLCCILHMLWNISICLWMWDHYRAVSVG